MFTIAIKKVILVPSNRYSICKCKGKWLGCFNIVNFVVDAIRAREQSIGFSIR